MAISLIVQQQFTYRTQPEIFSNRYHFTGAAPATDVEWKALADGVIAKLRPCMSNAVTFVGAYGYLNDTSASVFQVNYADPPNTVLAGTYAVTLGTGNARAPGDTAVWVRWATARRNSKGRPIYLRKYYHDVYTNQLDALNSSQRTALVTMAGGMTDGTLPAGRKLADLNGDVAGTSKVPTYVTTRTLKRRGPDPS